MMSTIRSDSLGFNSSVDAVRQFESDLASIEAVKLPTMFILMNRPAKYIPMIARCTEVEKNIRIAFSMFSADDAVADHLQHVYDRVVHYRKSLENKFTEINNVFKASIVMIITLFCFLSSFVEKLVSTLGYVDSGAKIHRIADAMNHSAISFIMVGGLIYLVVTAYDAKRRYFS